MKGLKKVLVEQITDMKVNDITPCGTEIHSVYLDKTEKDNTKWLELITEALKTAKYFEIHCWNEETDWIEFALQYGTLKESTWNYGKIMEGEVTPEFVDMILGMPKPTDVEIYNKMTPFFNIFLNDTNFQSCHYGTEIYMEERMNERL